MAEFIYKRNSKGRRRTARSKFHSYTQPRLDGEIPYRLRNPRKRKRKPRRQFEPSTGVETRIA